MSENKSVFNRTFCQLLSVKPNCTKNLLLNCIVSKGDRKSKSTKGVQKLPLLVIWLTFQVLQSRADSWSYPQTLDKDGKACQGQTL